MGGFERCQKCGSMVPVDQMDLHLDKNCGGLDALKTHIRDVEAFGGKGSQVHKEMLKILRKTEDTKEA